MERTKLEFCHRIYTETRSASRLFQAYMDPLFAELGLRSLEGCLLAELNHCDGRTIGELSQATSVAQTNLPQLWHALEAKGLIERRQDLSDGRSYRLYLTNKGCSTLDALDELVSKNALVNEDEILQIQEQISAGFASLNRLFSRRSGNDFAMAAKKEDD